MAAALQRDKLEVGPGRCQFLTGREWGAPIISSMNDQHRTADGLNDFVGSHGGADGTVVCCASQYFGRGLQAPGDAVFDTFGGVWFTEDLAHKKFQEVTIIFPPVDGVEFFPPAIGFSPCPECRAGSKRQVWTDQISDD